MRVRGFTRSRRCFLQRFCSLRDPNEATLHRASVFVYSCAVCGVTLTRAPGGAALPLAAFSGGKGTALRSSIPLHGLAFLLPALQSGARVWFWLGARIAGRLAHSGGQTLCACEDLFDRAGVSSRAFAACATLMRQHRASAFVYSCAVCGVTLMLAPGGAALPLAAVSGGKGTALRSGIPLHGLAFLLPALQSGARVWLWLEALTAGVRHQ